MGDKREAAEGHFGRNEDGVVFAPAVFFGSAP
jgi:hypothetical protein